MDRDSYESKTTDVLQDTETYIQLWTNPPAKTQNTTNAFISKLQKKNNVTMVLLYTKIPVDLALDVVRHRQESWTDISSYTKWSVNDICQSLKICLNAAHLHLRENNHKQIFRTAMWSSASAVIANMLMGDVETH